MRSVSMTVAVLCLAATSAQAQLVLTGTEGACSDWDVRWELSQGDTSEFSGRGAQRHVGGPCGQPTNARVTASVFVLLTRSMFAALKTDTSDKNDCIYFGGVRNGEIAGQYFCKSGGPFAFRFQAEGDRQDEARGRRGDPRSDPGRRRETPDEEDDEDPPPSREFQGPGFDGFDRRGR